MIDIAVSSGSYDGSGSIIRGYTAIYSFSVNIVHISGSYPIAQTGGDMHNYKIYYRTSNTSLINTTDAFMSGGALHGDMELRESQKGLYVDYTGTLRIRTSLKLTKAQCEYMAYMCVMIANHENSSYEEENSDNNMICINVSTFKVCTPGMT